MILILRSKAPVAYPVPILKASLMRLQGMICQVHPDRGSAGILGSSLTVDAQC